MKILVTGGAGFIGSHTVVELLNKNHDVVVVDNFCNSKEYVLNNIKKITGKSFKFYKLDLCDIKSLEKVFLNENIECVIHFAALKSGAYTGAPINSSTPSITAVFPLAIIFAPIFINSSVY